MDSKTKGAWIIHHGRKLAVDTRGASEYSALDFTAKTATLLARLAETRQASIDTAQVIAVAKAGGLNPRSELEACLKHLTERRLIERNDSGIDVLGVSSTSALEHASLLFEDNDPQQTERAALELAEIASTEPVPAGRITEYIGDKFHLRKLDAREFIHQATDIGFVDSEGTGDDLLIFNGNLFRRETASKTRRVLDSLSSDEQSKIGEFSAMLKATGCVHVKEAERILGKLIFDKCKAAGLFDVSVVGNDAGQHPFVTAPGAFHKFTNPMVDDAFDHAKALVAALTYGMTISSASRGRIWAVDLLLRKLLRGESVGPATAIGNDYRALEYDRVVKIDRIGGNLYLLTLLKRHVGELALEVLQGRNGAAAALEASLPSAGMAAYTPPEPTRSAFRKTQGAPSKRQTQELLIAIRGGSI